MASIRHEYSPRPSFANRISSIFERRQARSQDPESARATTTFEVPLFLSPARYQPSRALHDEDLRQPLHSYTSTQSLLETAPSSVTGERPAGSIAPSSRYSTRPPSPVISQADILPSHETTRTNHPRRTHRSAHSSRPSGTVHARRRRKHRSSSRQKVQGLKRLSGSFGATLLVTLVTYLVLAVTGTAMGIMFHVLMILLILTLTGVFAHCTIRLFIETRFAKQKRIDRRRTERWYGHITQRERPYGEHLAADMPELQEEHLPEKPIPIIMAEDEHADDMPKTQSVPVRHPPPVYGNFRFSKRINPGLVHWQKVPPSPLTPTYDEAMSEVHRAVGYRPPSYVESESGVTHIIEYAKQDVDNALRDIHPLERQRIAQLTHTMI